jgi:hypothetical protein
MKAIGLLVSILLLTITGCIQQQAQPQQSNQPARSASTVRSPTAFYREFDAKALIQQLYPSATDIYAGDSASRGTNGSFVELKKEIHASFTPVPARESEFNARKFIEQIRARMAEQLIDAQMKVEVSGITEGGGMHTFHVRYEKAPVEGWANVVGISGTLRSEQYYLYINLREAH